MDVPLFYQLCEIVKETPTFQSSDIVINGNSQLNCRLGSNSFLSLILTSKENEVTYHIENVEFPSLFCDGVVRSVGECTATLVHDAEAFLFGGVVYRQLAELCKKRKSKWSHWSVAYNRQDAHTAEYAVKLNDKVPLRLSLFFANDDRVGYFVTYLAKTQSRGSRLPRYDAYDGLMKGVWESMVLLESGMSLEKLDERLSALIGL